MYRVSRYFASLVLALLLPSIQAQASSVENFAGNAYGGTVEGVSGFARLSSPYSLVKTAAGKIYSINQGHNVSLLNEDGSIALVYGSDQAGNIDALGLDARFNSPRFAALDSASNLYLTDYNNHSIRKINLLTNEVSTYAGSGSGYLDGDVSLAKFKNPTGITIDANDNIYVADYGNVRIRKIDTDTGVVSTIAGIGGNGFLDGAALSAKFNQIQGLAIGPDGNLYIADSNNKRIRKLDLSTGQVSTVAGSGVLGDNVGAALSTQFKIPLALTFAADGSLFISDSGNSNIKKLDFSTGLVSLVIGTNQGYRDGNEMQAMFQSPAGLLFLDENALLISDTANHSVRKLDLTTSYEKPELHTIAGRNFSGNTDGIFGLNRLNTPRGMVKDSLGNIFFADSANHRIRKIDAGNASVSTFAGSSSGYTDAQGIVAKFSTPCGLVIDSADNIYVADWGNHKIRKIDTAGNVSTYAGSSQGLLDGLAGLAQFKNPRGLAIDSADNIYVADYGNNVIRKISPDQNVVTLAGTGSAGLLDGLAVNAKFRNPFDIVVDLNGNLFVSDYSNHAIRKISLVSGNYVVSTIAGGSGAGNKDGDALSALFAYPAGLALDPSGNLFIADRNNNSIKVLNADAKVKTLIGTAFPGFYDGKLDLSSFNLPEYLLLAGDSLLIADSSNHRIREVDLASLDLSSSENPGVGNPNFQVSTFTGFLGLASFRDGTLETAYFRDPQGMNFDLDGNLLVADRSNHRIRKITIDGQVSTFAGSSSGYFDDTVLGSLFNNPADLVVDSFGNVFVSDYGNHTIRKISISGLVTSFAGNGNPGSADGLATLASFKNPYALAIDSSDNIYVSDYGNNRIRKISPDGNVTTIAGQNAGFKDGPVSQAKFNRPKGIAVNENGDLFIADTNNHRIRKISNGMVSTLAGAGFSGFADEEGVRALFNSPSFLKITKNHLLVADTANNKIRKISFSGKVETLVGTGIQGYRDDTGDKANFSLPQGLAVDNKDQVYLTESSNRIRFISVRKVLPSPDPVVIKPEDSIPIIEMVSDINFDSSGRFTVLQGANLNVKVFAYDYEEGTSVTKNLVWDSSLDGVLASGITKLDTSGLSVGTHSITVSVADSVGQSSYLHFILVVIDKNTDLENGGVDVNGDGVIDENDRIVAPQATNSRIVRIASTSKNIFKRRSGKFRAVAFDLDEQSNVAADISSRIIWERETADPDFQEFLDEGSVLKLSKLAKGTYNLIARVDDTESKIQLKVGRKKVKVLD